MSPGSFALLSWWVALASSSAELPTLDLAALLAEAEAQHPALLAADERREAAESGPSVVAALPDPEISLAVENASLDRWTLGESEMSNVAASWTQVVPSRSRRRAEVEVAWAERDARVVEMNELRWQVRAAVKAGYVELLRVDRARAVLQEQRWILETLRDVARVRYETGEGLLRDALEAGTAIARLDLELSDLDRDRDIAAARLAAALGRTEAAVFEAAIEEPDVRDLERDTLAAAAETVSPALGAVRAEAAVRDREVEVRRWEARPEWMWRAGYASRGGLDPIVMGMVGVRLPLRADRKQHRATEMAAREASAARRDVEAVRAELLGELRERLAEVDGTGRRIERLEGVVLPQTLAVFEASEAAYRSGRLDLATVLRDFGAALDDRRELEDLRAERLQALVALESLAGAELVVPRERSVP